MQLVAEILSHPAIWPHIHEDGTDEAAPHDLDGFHWLLVSDGAPAGVFLAHPRSAACYEVHTCLLPRIWGAGAARAAQLLLEHLFQVVGCEKVVTNVPTYNRPALRFAKASGMQVEGNNRSSFLRNGRLEDQIMLGITRKEWTCQQ
ncbi:GNAT family N-acetyltransferase [Massilia timonae]|uniref:GNAT family N-acetyltransferase n=1 Tax=Massilia timonae TaxID=47229 RepID=UPI0028AF4D1B|nr:GNAT family protein [Massilia timonae]